MDSDIMTIREVAEYLKLTENTAYRHAADGKIPGFKVGGAWRGIVKLTDYRLFSAFLHETKPLKLRKVAIDNLRRFRSESD